MLKLNNEIHKIMISTPSRFVGEYLSEYTAVQLSFSSKDLLINTKENPNSRTFLVATFRYAQGRSMIRKDLSIFGNFFCTVLSLLYGKEFKNHGMLESDGIHRTPNLELLANEYYFQPQYNYKTRKDISIPLNLSYFKLVEPLLLEENLSEGFCQMVIAAGKFYNRALSIYPIEPELAFLDLITSGEIISNFNDKQYTDEQLYDENLLKNFKEISTLQKGDRIVRDLKKRLFQVKRKFFHSLIDLLDDNFYENTEAMQEIGIITKGTIEQSIKSTYDLRSSYVHTGLEFKDRIRPLTRMQNEISLGNVKHPNKNTAKALSNTLTFTGLERIIRYALLKLIHNNGVKIDEKLD
ncbi:HEPN domain-containing protein [Bacillus thuringiensis]